jgi:MFS transporter, Spinster family, sphingosine-1-phosphate transporter
MRRGSTPLSWTTAACPVGKQATSHARRSLAREGTARRAWGPPVVSRVKTIMAMAMAMTWSIATTACMFTQGYSHLLVAGLARAFVGLGEAGYGSVGAAMVATHFPLRMRARVLGGFFASASVGSVLGVILGGMIASRYGWRAGFGLVGVRGLILSLLYFFVRDYKTVEPANAPASEALAEASRREMIRSIFHSWTVRWICIGAAAQLISLSALWSWLPSYLNRIQQLPPDKGACTPPSSFSPAPSAVSFWGPLPTPGRAGLM